VNGERGTESTEQSAGIGSGPPRSPFPVPRSHILVVQTAFLGDVVLTTPLLSALASMHGPVDVVTTPPAAVLLEGHPAVAEVIRYDKRGADAGPMGVWRLGRRLRRRGYSRIYLPHRSVRSAILALLARAPERTGFADASGAVTYTSRVARPRAGHEVSRLLALAGIAPAAAPEVSLALTEVDRAAADEWMRKRGIVPGFVALAPGSIWGTKRWPYYPELAALLDVQVVAVGGPEDAALGDQVVAAAGGRAWNATGELGLRAAAALISRASVLVTNDSAPLHLAAAVGTPVVALFGPTALEQGFGPRGPRDVVVQHSGLTCRPCSSHGPRVCPLGHHRCMVEISVERVVAAVTGVSGVEARRAIRTGD
jgi:lipopolysaccharide heptosyltransferase II